jgi:GNAT superfamily N-acetyltransferase
VADVTFRLATSDDFERILEIVNAHPGVEAVALMGDEERARRYDDARMRLDPFPNESDVTMLAESDGRVVGVLRYRIGEGTPHSRAEILRLLLKVLGPVRLARRLPAIWSRTTVDIPVPPDCLHLANVHVDAEARGLRVGTRLLEWAEEEAARHGAKRLSITTIAVNVDGIRFYEHCGFQVFKTANSPSYEKRTKIPGRVMLTKDVQPEASTRGPERSASTPSSD